MKIFLRKFWQTHFRSIVSSALSHKLLCGVDIHIITDSTYFCYSPWYILTSQPPASTIPRKSVPQGVWPPDQALNTTILQCVYQKTVQNFVTERFIYILVGVTTQTLKRGAESVSFTSFFWGIDQTINSIKVHKVLKFKIFFFFLQFMITTFDKTYFCLYSN
jgi:hypothetical protein